MQNLPQYDERNEKDGGLEEGKVIRNFVPTWFASLMGTGSISILFSSFPYGKHSPVLKGFSLAFFFLNLCLLILYTALTSARYYLYPDTWSRTMRHPVVSLYWACLPMGITTLISVAVDVINVYYDFGGKPFLYFVWTTWWAIVILSMVCCWGLLHAMTSYQAHSLEEMTAAWLLPVVTLIVSASTGGILARALATYSTFYALLTLAFSAFQEIIGVTLALMLITVYLYRLIVHGLPPSKSIISVFLPLGPMGQSGYGILVMGQVFKNILPIKTSNSPFLSSPMAGDVIYVVCVCLSFLLWSLSWMVIIFALIALADTLRQTKLQFKLPFWGTVFPNGVFANLTINLGEALNSRFIKVWGVIWAIFTLLVWIYVAFNTLVMAYNKSIFEDPTLHHEGVQNERASGRPIFSSRTQSEERTLNSRSQSRAPLSDVEKQRSD